MVRVQPGKHMTKISQFKNSAYGMNQMAGYLYAETVPSVKITFKNEFTMKKISLERTFPTEQHVHRQGCKAGLHFWSGPLYTDRGCFQGVQDVLIWSLACSAGS